MAEGLAAELVAIATPPTLGGLYNSVKHAFRAAGLPTPELDARILTVETLGVPTAQLIANPRREVSEELAGLLRTRTEQRVNGLSMGRILGRRAFWSLDLQLAPACLEPRPETETVVELALSFVPADQDQVTIADLGVGSGAILLSILAERPNAFGVGLDIAVDALLTARANAERHQLSQRAAFVRGDFAASLGRCFDLIVSNPPYIASGAIGALEPTVRDHDPLIALDGGPDGLAAYRTVFSEAPRVLKPGAGLIVEIDPASHSYVIDEAGRNGLEAVTMAHDLTGVQRAIAFRVGETVSPRDAF